MNRQDIEAWVRAAEKDIRRIEGRQLALTIVTVLNAIALGVVIYILLRH